MGIGIKIQPDKNLKQKEVEIAIDEMLKNDIYKTRAKHFSLISKKYNGPKNSSDYLVDFFKSYDGFTKKN